MDQKAIKTKLTTAIFVIAVTAVLVLFVSTGTGTAATVTGEGGGRSVQLTGTNISANISVPAFVGLDSTYWNLSVTVDYDGASADITVFVWINDGSTNTSAFALAGESATGTASFTSSSFSANTSGVIGAALFVDEPAAYPLANATEYWYGNISIEEYAIIAALNYWIPVIITVAILVAILSMVTKGIGSFR